MDKRFAAYASFAYSLINLDTLEVSAVVTDVVHELDAGNDDYLVGVQRVAQDVDFLDARDDTDYNNACQILFVIKFDYQHHTFQRLNIASGSHFPDDNPVYSEEESERIEKQFHVDAGVLNYAKGGVARQFALSDFDRKANLRAIREIAADRAD